ncbi:hypothetical protein JCM3766R1_000897 [Sporobolomyces carnicolor]
MRSPSPSRPLASPKSLPPTSPSPAARPLVSSPSRSSLRDDAWSSSWSRSPPPSHSTPATTVPPSSALTRVAAAAAAAPSSSLASGTRVGRGQAREQVDRPRLSAEYVAPHRRFPPRRGSLTALATATATHPSDAPRARPTRARANSTASVGARSAPLGPLESSWSLSSRIPMTDDEDEVDDDDDDALARGTRTHPARSSRYLVARSEGGARGHAREGEEIEFRGTEKKRDVRKGFEALKARLRAAAISNRSRQA